jgi:hypothetical protein
LQLGLLCYVPADKKDKCDASEWMKAVLAPCNGELIEGTELIGAYLDSPEHKRAVHGATSKMMQLL